MQQGTGVRRPDIEEELAGQAVDVGEHSPPHTTGIRVAGG